MRRTQQQTKTITRRTFFLGGIQLALTSALVGRLAYLQFLKGEEFHTLAEDNRISLQLIAPLRGKILDRKGVELARNKRYYQVLLTKGNRLQTEKTLGRLTPILNLSPLQLKRIQQELSGLPAGRTILVKEYLVWDEVAKVEYALPELLGVSIATANMRAYPMAEMTSHLVGYVGSVSPEEKANEPLSNVPGFKIGKSGIEKMLEADLRGKAGVRQVEVNVHGVPVREVNRNEAVAGKTIHTTIDSRLQRFATERFKGESGALILLNTTDGEVRAFVATPSFDGNQFSRGISTDYWDALRGNSHNPLLNKAISGVYPPGSTFKCMMAAAALEEGVANASTAVYCPGHWYLGNHRFGCWKPEGHGTVTVTTALAVSCDVYFYTMAHRMGIDTMAKYGHLFGFGELSGIGLPGEKIGTMPNEAWKQKLYGQRWHPGDTISCGIGQGYMISTPLQTAVMTARIASGGKRVVPRLTPGTGAPIPSLGLKEETLRLVKEGMDMVVNHVRGTAYASRITESGFSMAGKTGTSQVQKITVHGVDQKTLPWHLRHHAWFVGYGPVASPELAVAVLVEHGGGGASAAAPIAKDVLLQAWKYEKGIA